MEFGLYPSLLSLSLGFLSPILSPYRNKHTQHIASDPPEGRPISNAMSDKPAGLSQTQSRASTAASRPSLLGRASNYMKGRRPPSTYENQTGASSSTASLAAKGAPKNASGLRPFQQMFAAPDPSVKLTKPAELTEAQEDKYQEVLKHFQSLEEYPTALKAGSPTEPLTEWEKLRMLSRESMIRYLRATKWDVTSAKKRLTDTIAWRREYGVDNLKAEDLEPEAKTGKETILGFDNKGRPLHYMHPSRNTTDETPRQMQFAVWILERAIDVMPPGVEMLALLINFGGKKRNPTSISNAKLMLYILQNHYVERLGIALCINVPWIFKAFWNAIYPFIDPVTKGKCKFDEAIKDEVPGPQLAADFGGELDFPYDHDKYWPQLVALTDKRREEQLERFRTVCNSEIGASEWVIRGGDELNRSTQASKQDSGFHEGAADALAAQNKLNKSETHGASSASVEKPAPIYEGEAGEEEDLDRFYTSTQELPPSLERQISHPDLAPSDSESGTVVNHAASSTDTKHEQQQLHKSDHKARKHGDASFFAHVVGGISAGLIGGKAASSVAEQNHAGAQHESKLHDKLNRIHHHHHHHSHKSNSPQSSTPTVPAV